REMASQIAALPPLALAVAKRALYQGAENDFDAAVQTETFGLEYLFKTRDHKEAVAAFLEKRPARFEGRETQKYQTSLPPAHICPGEHRKSAMCRSPYLRQGIEMVEAEG